MRHVMAMRGFAALFFYSAISATGAAAAQDGADEPLTVSPAALAIVPPPGSGDEAGTDLSLSDAVGLALLSNPLLGAASAAEAIAGERVEQARSRRGPSVSANAQIGAEYTDTNRAFAFDIGERGLLGAGLTATYPLYTGGRINAGIDQAEAGLLAAEAEQIAAAQDLFLQVAAGYADLVTAREAVGISERNVALLAEQLRASRARFDVGVVTRTDVAQSEARLEGARARLAAAEAGAEAASAGLAALTGVFPGELAPLTRVPPLPPGYDEALAAALEYSPDLRAALAGERAADAAINLARSAFKPQLSLSGSASVRQAIDGTEDPRDSSVSVLAQGSIPLYEGGLLDSRLREAQISLTQAKLRSAGVRRALLRDAGRLLASAEAARLRVAAGERQVDAAELAFQGARRELEVGTRTTLDVLQEEQLLFEARLGLAEARRDAFVTAHQLLRTMGLLVPDLMALEASAADPALYGEPARRYWLLTPPG